MYGSLHQRRLAAGIGLVVLAAACAKHDERYITDWLKVDVVRPIMGTSGGIIAAGPNREVYYVRGAGGWKHLGSGHPTSYLVLADQLAVLVGGLDADGRRGGILYRGQEELRRIKDVFGREMASAVLPERNEIDFYECVVRARPAGCRAVHIYRHDIDGKLLKTFRVDLEDRYSDCQIFDTVRGFDRDGVPYLPAQCKPTSQQAKCLLVAPRADGMFIFAVLPNRPWSDCADYRGLGVSLREPEKNDGVFF